MSEEFSMVQECTDSYKVRDLESGETEIYMKIPARFRDLWLAKLSGLRTSIEEIRQFEEPAK